MNSNILAGYLTVVSVFITGVFGISAGIGLNSYKYFLIGISLLSIELYYLYTIQNSSIKN